MSLSDASCLGILVRPSDSSVYGRGWLSMEYWSPPGPQTSVKVVGGQVTSVFHMLAMALDDPAMDDDLRTALAADEIEIGTEKGSSLKLAATVLFKKPIMAGWFWGPVKRNH